MSRRRRESRGAVMTLFSFQDVMTTVMGIMILVTLILALDLAAHVGKADQQEHAKEEAEVPQVEIETLEERSAALEAEYERASRRTARLAEAGGLDRTALEQAIAELVELQEEAVELEQEVERRQDEMEHSPEWERLQQRFEKIITTRREADKLHEQIEQRRRNPRLTYLIQDDIERRPVLLEVSGDRIGIGRPDDEESAIWLSQPRKADRHAALRELLALYDARSDYVVIMLKPSADIEAYSELRRLVDQRGFNIGLELLDEQQRVLP